MYLCDAVTKNSTLEISFQVAFLGNADPERGQPLSLDYSKARVIQLPRASLVAGKLELTNTLDYMGTCK